MVKPSAPFRHGSSSHGQKTAGMFDSGGSAIKFAVENVNPSRDAYVIPRENYWFVRLRRITDGGRVFVWNNGLYERTAQ
jgi:hypothetical protein